MVQSQLKTVAMIGEAITPELGVKMVKDFKDAYPKSPEYVLIGRNILDHLLSQPGCEGIRFYNALNEQGIKTLVYVAVDSNGDVIKNYTTVNKDGYLNTIKATIADRGKIDSDSGIEEALEELFGIS
jgi:hypothetical protein